MTPEFPFSFDSPNSIDCSIGSVSFSINVEYIAKMRFLFNIASIYPTAEEKQLVVNALALVNALISTNVPPQNSSQSLPMIYFFKTFLHPNCDYYSTENFLRLRDMLTPLLADINLWLAQNKEKAIKKQSTLDVEMQLMAAEEYILRQKIRAIASSGKISIPHDDAKYFINAGRHFKHTYNTWLYRIILDNEIAELYFLYICGAAHLKSCFIIQCLEHGNTNRAIELIDLLTKTSAYPDYAPKNGNRWELDALNTIKNVLREYLPSISSFGIKNNTEETRKLVVTMTERLMPYLTTDSRKELLGLLSLVDPYHKYEQQYIDTLINDISHYAQLHRPRGWAGARVVNRITLEISECFSILDEMGRIDIIILILSKLKAAGPSLTPINFERWLNDFCQRYVTAETFSYITNCLES